MYVAAEIYFIYSSAVDVWKKLSDVRSSCCLVYILGKVLKFLVFVYGNLKRFIIYLLSNLSILFLYFYILSSFVNAPCWAWVKQLFNMLYTVYMVILTIKLLNLEF